MDEDSEQQAAPVALAAKLDTSAARALHEVLTSHSGDDVALDGSAVEMVGGRCLELLLAGRHFWTAAGHRFDLVNPSEAMQRDLAALGAPGDLLATGDAI